MFQLVFVNIRIIYIWFSVTIFFKHFGYYYCASTFYLFLLISINIHRKKNNLLSLQPFWMPKANTPLKSKTPQNNIRIKNLLPLHNPFGPHSIPFVIPESWSLAILPTPTPSNQPTHPTVNSTSGALGFHFVLMRDRNYWAVSSNAQNLQ